MAWGGRSKLTAPSATQFSIRMKWPGYPPPCVAQEIQNGLRKPSLRTLGFRLQSLTEGRLCQLCGQKASSCLATCPETSLRLSQWE